MVAQFKKVFLPGTLKSLREKQAGRRQDIDHFSQLKGKQPEITACYIYTD